MFKLIFKLELSNIDKSKKPSEVICIEILRAIPLWRKKYFRVDGHQPADANDGNREATFHKIVTEQNVCFCYLILTIKLNLIIKVVNTDGKVPPFRFCFSFTYVPSTYFTNGVKK